jgi:hypothetical protein
VFKFIQALLAYGAQEIIRTQDGLPDDHITALAQGETGVIVGTTGGAAVWDGTSWSAITTSPVSSVSNSLVAAADGLWAYQDGAWIIVSQSPIQSVAGGGWYATENEVCRLATPAPVCPTREDGTPLKGALLIDSSPSGEELWVVDDKEHVWQRDPTSDKPDQFVNAHFEILYGPMKALLAAPGGPFFGSNAGFYNTQMPFGDNEMRVSQAEYTLGDGYRVRVRDLAFEPVSDRIWLATNQGVFFAQRTVLLEHGYGPSIWTALADLPTRDFTGVLPLEDGTVWLGTASQGLIHFIP